MIGAICGSLEAKQSQSRGWDSRSHHHSRASRGDLAERPSGRDIPCKRVVEARGLAFVRGRKVGSCCEAGLAVRQSVDKDAKPQDAVDGIA